MTISPPRRLLAATLSAVAMFAAAGCAGGGAPVTPPEPPPAATAPLTPADVTAWLDGLVPAALERTAIPGAAVSVVRDGEVIAARGYGTAGEADPVKADDTLFRVGSVSKVATAVAVLQQVERGRIDLDADVRQYLDFPLPLRFDPPVTMRHLLTHTPGFEERIRGMIGLDGKPEDLRASLATDPPEQVFAPGTTPAYSNYGYTLAGYVVERVSGEPFAQYMQREVLDRAGMTSSTFAQPLPEHLAGRMADGFPAANAPAVPFEIVGGSPAGALTGTATDLARFASSLLGTGTPLLAPETLELMRRPALDASTLGPLADGPQMTLGMFDESRGDRTALGHGGDTTAFHSHLQLHPEQRVGVFVTLNGGGNAAADSLTLRSSLLDGFADRYLPGSPQPAPTASEPGSAERAAAVTGRYENARAPFSTFLGVMNLIGQTSATVRPDGALVLSPGVARAEPVAYREIRPWVWQEIGGHQVLTARTDGDRVTALGAESAFTLLPTTPARDSAIVLPVLAASVALLLAGLAAWPVGALARRRYGAPAPVSPGPLDRTAQRLTRIGAACALLALAGWVGVVGAISGLTDVPAALLYVLQAVQWISVGGLLAAALAIATGLRGGVGRSRIAGRVLMLLGLAGTAWVAIAYGLLSTDIGY
ncbi:serine hydrolase domain-containing protein [Pseudonocardia parietis]|uniref:CubicO group peptidase (Beta-lactamase class C family) n=1 Tax=Pseudonocardia parietis TaxID=570936 RepID=A0ABS4VPY5_9PSEU|nr:serine hydrolase domain-containing protein [Pseudonocardia parietis]MBP2365988.1 CubicO group peptidase (beta-lactamase class C family) [Pseudonocardia parietis]